MQKNVRDDSTDDSVYETPLIKLMMSIKAAELTLRQWNVLALIIVHTFHSDAAITPKFISLKAFQNHTHHKAEAIQEALAFLIENRIVDRSYPDKTGLPFYAINPDPDTWTVWDDAPVAPQPQSDRDISLAGDEHAQP